MRTIVWITFSLVIGLNASSQDFVPNYDEALVPSYDLPDLFTFENGEKVEIPGEWDKRRQEIFDLFEHDVFGIAPKWEGMINAKDIFIDENAFGGKAICKELVIELKVEGKTLEMVLLMYLPKNDKPVPVFVGYNFDGNHATSLTSDISVTKSWVSNDTQSGISDNKASASSRGSAAHRWPFEEIVKRGYGVVTIYYGDIDPDFHDGFKNGVHALYNEKRDSSSWGSIAAWAWGLSRVMDYFETDPLIDHQKVAVIGHSRLGKTSLWAGAADTRFAMVISNNSGCGGAALSRRRFGETVGRINTNFPHWFADNFKKFNNKEDELPVDQHQLLALIAPRPLYVSSAEDDQWADPLGEFISALEASKVYRFLGKEGLPVKEMPAVHNPAMGSVGYHIREGRHDILLYDWQQFMNFADIHFRQ